MSRVYSTALSTSESTLALPHPEDVKIVHDTTAERTVIGDRELSAKVVHLCGFKLVVINPNLWQFEEILFNGPIRQDDTLPHAFVAYSHVPCGC